MEKMNITTLLKVYTWYASIYSALTLFFLEELSGAVLLFVFSWVAFPWVVIYHMYYGDKK